MKKILLLLLIASNFILNAQTNYENFNFGTVADTLTNPSIGGAIWKRHSGTGGPIVYNNSSLLFTGYNLSGVGGSISFSHNTGSREDANMPTTQYNSGAVYASFLLNVTTSGGTTGDYFFHFLDSAGATPGSNFRGRLFVKDGGVANTFKLGLSKGSAAASAVFSSVDYPINTPILVVLKYSFHATLTDTVYAFVSTSGVPSVEPATATLTSTDNAIADITKIASVCVRQGTVGTATCTIDGIMVSNSWNSITLPVKFTNFNATITNKQTNLTWTTASEINNKGFEVERSFDGKKFETVSFVKGNGNSNRVNKYSFVDANHTSAFYRLKQIDFDGKFDYSNIVKVKGNDLIIEITPNPFNENIEVSSNSSIINAEIIDITGKSKIIEIVEGNKAIINTSGLSNGIYFIKINNGETVITKRIIKN